MTINTDGTAGLGVDREGVRFAHLSTARTDAPACDLRLTATTLRAANAFVALHHRHHRPVRGCVCVVAVSDDIAVRGVAIIGRPLARMLQNGATAEVTRVCTDGARNACSMLYGAAWRAVKALGYTRLITYTLASEGGASLRAAGWKCTAETSGGSWSRTSRLRADERNTQPKQRWEAA